MKCPESITSIVLQFADTIIPDAELVYIDCTPLKGVPAKECFPIVEEHVAKHGGIRQLGWSIYLWPNVMIEGEFHSIWVDPRGIRRDIAPHQLPMKRILFLHDPQAEYGEFHQVNSRRMAVTDDPTIHRYMAACDRIYAEENAGDFAKKDHFIMTPLWKKLQQEKTICEAELIGKYGVPPGLPIAAEMVMKALRKIFS